MLCTGPHKKTLSIEIAEKYLKIPAESNRFPLLLPTVSEFDWPFLFPLFERLERYLGEDRVLHRRPNRPQIFSTANLTSEEVAITIEPELWNMTLN
jgi:hypothetical protein